MANIDKTHPVGEVKKWKLVETQLNHAAALLNDPQLFILQAKDLAEYRYDLRIDELSQAMIRLETIAKNNGCRSGFWRWIKQVAETIGDREKIEAYEREFHLALSQNLNKKSNECQK